MDDAHKAEYFQRLEKARILMAEQGLDALLLFTGPNLVYFTGATGMIGGRSGSRPFLLLLPLEGDPVLIVHAGRQFESRTLTPIADIRTYTRLSHLPLQELVEAMLDRKLHRSHIGLELANEMVLDLPYRDYEIMLEALPNINWQDASDLLWKLRQIKSPFEIDLIAQACTITSQAYASTFEAILPGMTEAEIQMKMLTEMMVRGGSSPWVLITSGEGNYDLVSKGGGARRVQKGDMVWMDAGCSYGGYNSDFSRAGVLGKPTHLQREAQKRIHELTVEGIEMLRPGTSVAEIAARLNKAVEALDWPITSNISGLAGRVGHSIGMLVTELPSLSEEDPTVLKSGMVVSMEPAVATPFGTFHVEENILITEGEPCLLSSPHWELWQIE